MASAVLLEAPRNA